MAELKIKVSLVSIPENSEGAARLLAQIAKPTNVVAGMKKLRDFHLVLEGERPFNNRSRDQVLDAVSTVWTQLRHAIEVGDWFDRMFANLVKSDFDHSGAARDYARSLASSLKERDKKTVWKPYLPVAHLAAGFRETMLKTRRGRYFEAGNFPRSVQLEQVRDLLFDDHSWLGHAVKASQARIVLPRQRGVQPPADTRWFMLTAGNSQESTPASQK
ncbi:hypothetical protein [Sphingomonas sp.]|uniref:hypothetical protein n=1 Tax=Sphingomonas sp. TaxID=28214 RepID=UPI003B3AB780